MSELSPVESLPRSEIVADANASLPRTGPRDARLTRKIRVGVFSQYYPEYRDAVFARLSQDLDFEFTFLAGSPPSGSFIRGSSSRPYTYRPITVSTIPIIGTRNSLSYRGGQISALLRRRFDVLLLTNDVLGPDIWVCCLLSRLVRVPVCIWGQGLSRPPSRFRNGLRYALTALATASVYYSDGGKQYWVHRGLPADKLFVAYNALDTDKQIAIRESMTPDAIASFLAAQGLAGKRIVTFLGRLVPGKKPRVFIDAVAWAAAREPTLVGVLIGDGPQRQELEQRARDEGVGHAMRFVGESYDEELLARYLTASVAVVVPADAGLVIQHAAVYGTPLVLGDVPGRHAPEQEIVEEAKTGLWCPDEDIVAFGTAILRLIRDSELRRAISSNLIRVIAEKYNVASMAQGFLDALHYCMRK